MAQVMFGDTAFFVVSSEYVDGRLKRFDVDTHVGVVATLDEAVAAAELVTGITPAPDKGPEDDDEAVIYWLVPVGRVKNGEVLHRCTDTHTLLLAASKAAKERQR